MLSGKVMKVMIGRNETEKEVYEIIWVVGTCERHGIILESMDSCSLTDLRSRFFPRPIPPENKKNKKKSRRSQKIAILRFLIT